MGLVSEILKLAIPATVSGSPELLPKLSAPESLKLALELDIPSHVSACPDSFVQDLPKSGTEHGI